MAEESLFSSELQVANVGLDLFAETLVAQGIEPVRVEWRPPADGMGGELWQTLAAARIAAANERAVRRMLEARPVLVDVRQASEVLPGMSKHTLFHAGPPVTWERMCGPLRGAVIGALLYEELAHTEQEALALVERGEIEFSPCHHHQAVGPMAGVISASMPVYVLENQTHGNRAFSNLNEGLGKVLRYGANDQEVLDRLRWMRDVLGPALSQAIRASGGVDVKQHTAQALQMGDECHNRNRAASSILIRTLAPFLVETSQSPQETASILRFMGGNQHFYLNISMAACKASADAASGEPFSSLVTTMARNGTDFGIRVSGLGDRWYTGQAQQVRGLYFTGFSEADANPDIGDSTISETVGIGAFAMAAAPAIAQFVGGTPADALRYTLDMYDITLAEDGNMAIPSLDFRGAPAGIDVRKVVHLNRPPIINTGIAHRLPGIGQIGAGIVEPPMTCFTQALADLAKAVQPAP
ncbi:MAG TPA: DUF1116 domain-containing protein [Ktedonobacterales bacterium]|nr:DUF1116 domain-containing protein [Ktedonobacterales bacterium]